MLNAIGAVELSSIAKGFEVMDLMLKTSEIKVLLSRSICPGKFLILVAGDVSAVSAAVEAGTSRCEYCAVDNFIIPNIDPQVFPAIENIVIAEKSQAFGCLETFSVAAVIEAADAAVKAADVKLMEIRLAMAIGGKGFFTVTGSVAGVQTAIEAAAMIASRKGLLVDKTVIANPRKELFSDNI